jgi:hypothetical protein
MTVIQPNSVSGINSITVQNGNSLSIHKSDGSLIRTITGTTGLTTFRTISVGSATTDFSQGSGINIGLGASISNGSGNELTFGTGGDDRVRITGIGSVGIGTLAPHEVLHVYHPTANGVSLFESGDATTWIGFRDSSSTYPNLPNIGCVGDDFRYKSGGTERLRITSAGKVGINSAIPGYTLDMVGDQIRLKSNASSSNAVLRLWGQDTNTGGAIIAQNSAGNAAPLYFYHSNTDLGMTLDSSGRLLVGTTSSATINSGDATLQVKTSSKAISILQADSNDGGGNIDFGKSRGGAVVQSGDNIGNLFWNAHDGTDYATRAAAIQGWVDTTPGGNDMPGRITFSTTADGAASLTERLRIDSGGNVSVGDVTANNYASSLGQLRIINNALSTPASLALYGYGNTNTGDTFAKIQFAQQETGYTGQVTAEIKALAVGTDERGTDLTFTTRPNTSGSSPLERLRIDSSGRLLIGLTAAVSLPYSTYGAIQTQGSYSTSSINIINNEDNGNTSALTFNKIRGSGAAGGTDAMGGINWGAYDGSAWRSGVTIEGKLTSIGSNAVPSKLIFKVNSGSSNTERFAITPNGVTFNGDTAAANALNDYEEGTFTPTYNNGTVTYSAQYGFYIRVGNIVHCFFDMTVASCSGQANAPYIGGFPFNKYNRIGSPAYYYEGFTWWYLDNSFTNSTACAQGYMINGTNYGNMYCGPTPMIHGGSGGSYFIHNQVGRLSGTVSYTAQ